MMLMIGVAMIGTHPLCAQICPARWPSKSDKLHLETRHTCSVPGRMMIDPPTVLSPGALVHMTVVGLHTVRSPRCDLAVLASCPSKMYARP